MTSLNLSPKEYLSRVYFSGAQPVSLRTLEAAKGINNKPLISNVFDPNVCFFIIDPIGIWKKKRLLDFQSENQTYNLFLSDNNIIIRTPIELSLKELNIPKSFFIYTYLPKYKQSCYNNLFNPFFIFSSFFIVFESILGLSKIEREITLSLSPKLIPLMPFEDRPLKTLSFFDINLIHFPFLVLSIMS